MTYELLIFLVLLFIGILIIIVVKALIHFVVPIVATVIVWFYTRSLVMAGVAFVTVALIQTLLRRR
ncbi:MAG: hypothetical protein V1857_00160 [archaeon]